MLLKNWLVSDQFPRLCLESAVARRAAARHNLATGPECLEVRIVPASTPLITIEKAVTTTEGNTGTTDAEFVVKLSSASEKTITVNFATADGTAKTADGDYLANTGKLTFNPGETEQIITVKINGDTRDEKDETYSVKLSAATNARLGLSKATGTITNDDAPLTLSINSPSAINEGDTGNATLLFTVTLSQASTGPVTVAFASADGTATTADSDYQSTTGTLTFNAGETTKEIAVKLTGDKKKEPDESFKMVLSNPSTGVSIKSDTGTGTITNDDTGLPTLSIDSTASVAEGNTGTTDVTLHVKLSEASTEPVKVRVSTGDDTATVDDSDYVKFSNILTFAPNETDKTVVIRVNGDTSLEANETFKVNLTAPEKATIETDKGISTVTITNDDTGSVSIAKTTDAAETTPPTNGRFTLTQTGVTSTDTVVTYTTTGTATSGTGNDYQALSGSVTIPAGKTTAVIDVIPFNDTTVESAETVIVTLTGFTTHDANVSLDPSAPKLTATVNILDASSLPALGGVTDAVTYKASQAAINVVPTITARGDSLAGGKLIISTTAVGTGTTATDQFTFPSTTGLGTATGPKFENGQVNLSIQLNQNVTADDIQTFLRAITFSTKDAGLDTATRSFKITLSDAANHTSTLSQTINVQK